MRKFFIGLPLALVGALTFLSLSGGGFVKNHEPPFDDCPWEGCF